LNFANSQNIGGGYLNGSIAQEEDLCRTMINLFGTLATYPHNNNEYKNKNWHLKLLLYSQNVKIYRTSDYQYTINDDIFTNILSAAMPALNIDYYKSKQTFDSDEINQIYILINLIIYNIIYYSFKLPEEIIILGAIGLGAFSPKNNVLIKKLTIKHFSYENTYENMIADIFKKYIMLFDFNKKIICFSIIDNKNTNNYEIFRNIFTTRQFQVYEITDAELFINYNEHNHLDVVISNVLSSNYPDFTINKTVLNLTYIGISDEYISINKVEQQHLLREPSQQRELQPQQSKTSEPGQLQYHRDLPLQKLLQHEQLKQLRQESLQQHLQQRELSQHREIQQQQQLKYNNNNN